MEDTNPFFETPLLTPEHLSEPVYSGPLPRYFVAFSTMSGRTIGPVRYLRVETRLGKHYKILAEGSREACEAAARLLKGECA